MAHFNQCSQLVSRETLEPILEKYADILANGENPFDVMINMQRSLQKRLAQDKPERNPDPDSLETAGQIVDWMRIQKDSMDDEFRELLTSLGGMSNGEKDASSVWKNWKAKNLEMRAVKIKDMSPEDQLEIKFEMIDAVHFFINQLLALNITGEELFSLYYLKNKENFARQDRGY